MKHMVSVGFVSATVRTLKRKLVRKISMTSILFWNYFIHLCTKYWGHRTLLEVSGWICSSAKIWCHVQYLHTFKTRTRELFMADFVSAEILVRWKPEIDLFSLSLKMNPDAVPKKYITWFLEQKHCSIRLANSSDFVLADASVRSAGKLFICVILEMLSASKYPMNI